LATHFLSIKIKSAKNQYHNPSLFLPIACPQGGHFLAEAFRFSELLFWNGGEAAAAARVRRDCAVEALLRIEFLVLLVQAKRT